MSTLTQEEYRYYLNWWCKQQGIKYQDWEHHSQIEDVILLIRYIKEFQQNFNDKDRKQVWICWDWVYRTRLPLKKRHTKWLLKIGTTILGRQSQTKRQRQQANNLIKSRRRHRTLA